MTAISKNVCALTIFEDFDHFRRKSLKGLQKGFKVFFIYYLFGILLKIPFIIFFYRTHDCQNHTQRASITRMM
jgi:hypothetical protein